MSEHNHQANPAGANHSSPDSFEMEVKRRLGIDIAGQSEEELRQNYMLLVLATETANAGWGNWNMLTGEASWSEQGKRIIGFPSEEEARNIQGWYNRIHPDDRPKVEAHLAEVMSCKHDFQLEYRIIQASGEIRWVFGSGKMLYNKEGKAYRSSGMIMDITERKKAEEELTEFAERLRMAADVAQIYSWEFDMNSQMVKYSDSVERITGLKPRRSFSENMKNVHPDDRQIVLDAFERAIQHNEKLIYEVRRLTRNNQYEWFLVSGVIIRDANNKPVRAVGVSQNTTERKKLEQQKDVFIGIASHELKTPVTSIKAYAEILQELLLEANDPERAALMGRLNAQVDRLTELINALLDTTNISEGRLVLQPEQINMKELIEECVEALQRVTLKHRLILQPTKVPPVMADRERIAQVLNNLISNAIKYSPDGGDVIISAESTDHHVLVKVRDFGIGMAEDMQNKVFERFYRVNSKKVNHFPGLGLGLYISSQIIKRHHGTIGVESKPGEGSTFYFSLPV